MLELLDRFAADPATRDAGRLRWAVAETMHLTIRFLGATPEPRAADAGAAVEAAVSGLAPFEVRLSGAGAFPSNDRPRAVWLGIASGASELAAIARRLDAELERRGWPPESRPFRAHLTLARADGVPGAARAVATLAALAASLDASWTADRLVLFRSILGRGPARHEPLATGVLAGEPPRA